jgi:NADPH:quinone reductase
MYGLAMGYEFTLEPPMIGLTELADMVAASRISPEISREADWSEIAVVARQLMDRTFTGKAVLRVR